MGGAYYNEIDPYAAQWLRNLIAAGHIAPGEVDERSILEIKPDDLRGFTQCHFFAGIGVWSYALRCAGWPDDRPVWTGSCPCQPFSGAGKGDEFADERHLWPAFGGLIRERRPVTVFGEQVASKDALAWIDHVSTDLEAAGYTFGAVDTCAAGFGAPHIRQRLYFVADSEHTERRQVCKHRENGRDRPDGGRQETHGEPGTCGEICFVADAEHDRRRTGSGNERGAQESRGAHGHNIERRGILGDTIEQGLEGHGGHGDDRHEPGRIGAVAAGSVTAASGVGFGLDNSERNGRDAGWSDNRGNGRVIVDAAGPCNGFWSDAIWLPCRDGKNRPTKPGIFPLAAGAKSRVGRLRAYGNAINAEQAAEFIKAWLEVMDQ